MYIYVYIYIYIYIYVYVCTYLCLSIYLELSFIALPIIERAYRSDEFTHYVPYVITDFINRQTLEEQSIFPWWLMKRNH